jgi:hypothetical protein
MSLASVVNVQDLRRLARARLPDAVFDYLDGAADDEVTLMDSERAFKEVIFKPRFAVATPSCDLVSRCWSKTGPAFLLAPIGYSRLMHPRGELAASNRGETAPPVLSTMSGPHRGCQSRSTGPTFINCTWRAGAARRGAIAAQGRRLQGAVRHHRHASCRQSRARYPTA